MKNAEIFNQLVDFPPKGFLHPERGSLPPDNEIPLAGKGIRGIVDAVRPSARFGTMHPQEGTPRTLDEVAYVVRLRYPESAEKVDQMYQSAMESLQDNPGDASMNEKAKRAIALTGAFNNVRGIQVLRKSDPDKEIPHDANKIPTANVERDTDIAPNFTLSPSALYQLQEHTGIEPGDDVLYLCSGAGGGVFFTAAAMPETLDAVDLYTPDYYDLEGTFTLANEEIYAKIPPQLRPEITTPHFIKGDASHLPAFGSDEAQAAGFQKEHYNKILLHPPYGRESMLAENLQAITEADGFMLWVNSILAVSKANGGDAQLFSIVPPEWGRAIDAFKKGQPMEEVLGNMYKDLRNLPYYKGENAAKLEQPYDKKKATVLDERRQEIETLFSDETYSRHDLKEMGMFPLQINELNMVKQVQQLAH